MKNVKPVRLDRRRPDTAREAMEDIKEITGDSKPIHNDIQYVRANRDRALGEADRTGRHFDEEAPQAPDAGSAASRDQEAG